MKDFSVRRGNSRNFEIMYTGPYKIKKIEGTNVTLEEETIEGNTGA
jgi:hypothetical protein